MEIRLVLPREIPPGLDDLVAPVRNQVEDVLFQVRAGAGDGVDVPGPDHASQDDAQLPGGHGPCQGDEHLPARRHVGFIGLGRPHGLAGVEVPIVLVEEVPDSAHDLSRKSPS